MARVRDWFMEHPPSAWVRFLEGAVKILNALLLVTGVAVLIWSIVTVVQIQHEPSSNPPAPPPVPHALLLQEAVLQPSLSSIINHAKLANVPWFIFVFGALGAATALTAVMALLGTRLRSPGCVSSHIFFMCLLLTGQACAAVAFFIDAGWEQRLPDIDEQLKKLLAQRLQVCKWLGVGLFLLQLLTLLLSCGLQGAYVAAEEAAEDADEEAAWRRRPLLAAQARRQQAPGRSTPSPVGGAAAAGAGGAEDDGWSERMQQQYGLDTSQFGYMAGSRGAAGEGAGRPGEGSSKACVIM